MEVASFQWSYVEHSVSVAVQVKFNLVHVLNVHQYLNVALSILEA